MKKRSGKIILLLLCFILSFQIINGKKDTFFLVCKAKTGTPAKYEYDKLGRVKKIIYNDNRVVEYKYDANGNILEVKIKDNNSTTEEKKDNREDTDKQEKDVDNQDAFQEPSKDNNVEQTEKTPDVITPVNNTTYSLKELEYINIFKKSRPIIKSLKKYKKKGNIYLQLDICNIKNNAQYKDIQYQIKYSRKSNFKSTKSTTIPQTSKSKYTRKQWKVAKNKTYYVKVRMSAKIKSGRRIYSRYSNTKKIKTPKK